MVPEGWTETSLGSLLEFKNGFNTDKSNYGHGTPFINVSEVLKFASLSADQIPGMVNVTEKEASANSVVRGDILFNRTSETPDEVGFTSVYLDDVPVVFGGFVIRGRPTSDALHPEFGQYAMRQPMVRYEIIRRSQGAVRSNIGQGELSKVPVQLPPLPEQRKIADILSTWDDAIETTEALLSNARTQKRALMQQLLTGKRRFPEFEGQPWKEVRLGDVITSVKRPLEWSDDALYRLISVRRRSGGLFHREDLYGRDIKTKNLKTAQAGDFLISKMQVVHGAMGLVTEAFDGMQISGSYISVISKVKDRLSIKFFDWLSRMPKMYHQAYLCSYGVHIEKMTFSFDLFLKESIVIPPSFEEQEKIVSALEAAQAEERELEDTITKLRTEKKALMQQLLTGKRRVTV